ncbi:MAG TPA: class I SAM-dependent methyltransferase [Trueperaceae bacterium]|nr:class I SAM-dependent methyltransferase [Trueperaceae bacterium]
MPPSRPKKPARGAQPSRTTVGRRDRGAGPAAARGGSSWQSVAEWYDATVGVRGSPHHRKAAIPTVMRLAEVVKGELVLDVGCGQGVLAHHVLKAGARYLGVDASQAMIRLAKRRREGVDFEVGDARDLMGTTSVERGSVDVAVLMLSLQDMDPLDQVVASVATTLRPGGRVVVFLVHPAFRAPRGSGWGFDEARKLVYRRVERYLTPAAVPMKAYAEVSDAQRGATISFHRPVQDYVAALVANGMVIDAFEELPDPVSFADKAGSPEIPLFLALRARRTS